MECKLVIFLFLLEAALGSQQSSSNPSSSPIISSISNIQTTSSEQSTSTPTTTDTTSTTVSTDPCSKGCDRPGSQLCYATQDNATCECSVTCCEPPVCEFGVDWNNCDCTICACLDPTISPSPAENCSDPCPSVQDRFCYMERKPFWDCSCMLVCCEPPECPGTGVDWQNCYDCFNCPCIDSSASPSIESSPSPSCNEPCEQPEDRFCFAFRNPDTCECMTGCCELPFCEGGIDWAFCTDCNHCRCLPYSPSPPSNCSDKVCATGVDWANCFDCDNCPCLEDSSPSPSNDCSAPCPSHEDRFCWNTRNQNCECEERCCGLPFCEFGVDFSRCSDCFNCECLPPPSPDSSSSSSSSSSSCAPCEQPDDRLCFARQDDETCECVIACCDPPICENGVDWEHCYDCSNCPCLPSPQNCTETCPCSDKRFCDYVQLENCTCSEVCCEPPTCDGLGVDWRNCESCSNCPCLPPSSSEPCQSDSSPSPSPDCNEPCPSTGSNFCFGIRDDFCVCQTVCCSPPECPGTGVDWPNCTSCSHCPCLPPSPASSHECDHD